MSLPDPSTAGAATAHQGMEHIMGSKKEKSRCESLICNGFIHLMAGGRLTNHPLHTALNLDFLI
ncbi:MAG: hypothetical protein H6930_05330 [Rhodoferax sp.]|nr:hypothetical protein [Rhodoferax sp.]